MKKNLFIIVASMMLCLPVVNTIAAARAEDTATLNETYCPRCTMNVSEEIAKGEKCCPSCGAHIKKVKNCKKGSSCKNCKKSSPKPVKEKKQSSRKKCRTTAS